MPDRADAVDDPPTHATLLGGADAGFVVNIRQDGWLYVAKVTRRVNPGQCPTPNRP